jgi:hypothetical protein
VRVIFLAEISSLFLTHPIRFDYCAATQSRR